MNFSKFTFVLCTLFSISSSYGDPTYGFLTRTVDTGRSIEMSQIAYLADWQEYTAGTGGITFTYPSDLFTASPLIQISIIQNGSHADSITYTPEVVSRSTTSTTIMVYQISSGVVSEAPTSSILVSLFALDNPTP